jgi:hypothetical protein
VEIFFFCASHACIEKGRVNLLVGFHPDTNVFAARDAFAKLDVVTKAAISKLGWVRYGMLGPPPDGCAREDSDVGLAPDGTLYIRVAIACGKERSTSKEGPAIVIAYYKVGTDDLLERLPDNAPVPELPPE